MHYLQACWKNVKLRGSSVMTTAPVLLLYWKNSVFQSFPEEACIDADELLAGRGQLFGGEQALLAAMLDLIYSLAHHADLAVHSTDGGCCGWV